MNRMQRATLKLAQACEGSPVYTTIVVMLFYIMFNVVEATIESLVFGSPRKHILDPFFQLFFIGYAAYAVYWCAVFNTHKGETHNVEVSGGAKDSEESAALNPSARL